MSENSPDAKSPSLPLISTPQSAHSRDQSSPKAQLLPEILAELQFFKAVADEYSQDAVRLLAKRSAFKRIARGEVLFSPGAPADECYIVLKGALKLESPDSSSIFAQNTLLGASALTSPHPWSSTCTALANTKLAVISKTDYDAVVVKLEELKNARLVEFFQHIPAFARMRKAAVHRIAALFAHRHYVRKQCVYRPGDQSEEVYIVRNGEFGLSQTVTPKVSEAIGGFRGRRLMYQQAEVALIGPGEFIGDVDVLENRPRTQMCVCKSTTGTLLVIGKQQYRTLFNEELGAELQESIEAKSQLREAQIRSIADRLSTQSPSLLVPSDASHTEMKNRSFSKKVKRSSPGLTMMRSRIAAHESVLLASTPQPKQRAEITVQSLLPRRVMYRESPISPIFNSEDAPSCRWRLFPKGGLIKDELKRGRLLRVATDHSSESRTSKTPSPDLKKITPIPHPPVFPNEETVDFGYDWDKRKRRAGHRLNLRNMKLLEVSKRNLFRSRCADEIRL